jgi:predicted alpha/beta-fold hydrolase
VRGSSSSESGNGLGSEPVSFAETASYQAPWWLPGGHAQTLYAALLAPRPRVPYRRERWDTPDGDFIDLDWLEERAGEPQSPNPTGVPEVSERPLVVLFHGLEGRSSSHYESALMAEAKRIGWNGLVVHFRGCAGEANRLQRAYHSGDSAEIDWILRRLRETRNAAPFVVGVSLGGNALLKWLGERGADANSLASAAAAVSAPVDLMAAGEALGRGFNMIYTRAFLRTLKAKSLSKLGRFPDLYDPHAVRRARTLREFDDVVTAPLHGFRDTNDYWTRASSKPWLRTIAVPTLLINARNDPFLPAAALPTHDELSPAVTPEFPDEGGHVGFVAGAPPGHLEWLPRRIIRFFTERSKPALEPSRHPHPHSPTFPGNASR